MKLFIFPSLLIMLTSCGAATVPATDSITAKKNSVTTTQAVADKRFAELDCEIDGTCPQNTTAPIASGNIAYDRTNAAADKAFGELDCETGKLCLTPGNESGESKVTETKTAEQLPGVQEKTNPNAVADKSLKRVTKYPIENGRPVWFEDPFYDGYLGGVGIAKPQARGGYATQRRVAVGLAQADLAKTVNVLVNTESISEKKRISSRISDSYDESFTTGSKHTSQQILKNSVVMDEWTDMSTGELYVWVVITK